MIKFVNFVEDEYIIIVKDQKGINEEEFTDKVEAVNKYNSLGREAIRESNSKTPPKSSKKK